MEGSFGVHGALTAAVLAGLACGAGACGAPTGEELGRWGQAATVDESVGLGCSTAVVRGLSEQIADEMLCVAPGMLVRLEEQPRVVFASDAVIPLVSPEARDALLDAVASASDELTINSAFRSVAQQYIIYRWFQAGDCGITAAAAPGNSNHESGRAIDVANYGVWSVILPLFGWAQTVLPSDPVHFEHLDSPDLRGLDVHAFQRLWNRNHPEDLIDEDGDYGAMTAARIGASPSEGFAIGACRVDGRAGALVTPAEALQLTSGERARVLITVTNTGSIPWAAGEYALAPAAPVGRASDFHDGAAWLSRERVAVLESPLATGEGLVFALPLLAPEVEEVTAFGEAFALVDAQGAPLSGTAVVVEIEVRPAGLGGAGCDDCSSGGRPDGSAAVLVGVVVAGLAGGGRRRRAAAVAARGKGLVLRYGRPSRSKT